VDFLATLDPITRTFRVYVRLRQQARDFIRSCGCYPHHVRLQFDDLADVVPMFQIELTFSGGETCNRRRSPVVNGKHKVLAKRAKSARDRLCSCRTNVASLFLFAGIESWLPPSDLSARCRCNDVDLLLFRLLGLSIASLLTFCHAEHSLSFDDAVIRENFTQMHSGSHL
jgi:hypothetical protein